MSNIIVYVSCADDRVIERFRMEPGSGTLVHLGSTQIPALNGPSASSPMAISPDRKFLYAALREEPFPVCTFAISPDDGDLVHLGTAPLPQSMAYVETDTTGRWLLSASYFGAVVAVSPIDPDGVVRNGATQVAKTPPNAHCVLPDPSGRFVYAPCLGGDVVLVWDWDSTRGFADPTSARHVLLAPGAGPRHLTFDRNGRMAYVLNERDGTVAAFARDDATGGLSLRQTIPAITGHPEGKAAAADIHLTPNGRFLYASVRRDSTIAVFQVAGDGTLTLVEQVAVETTPRGFEIDPTGRFLICAGRDAAAVGVYAIDPAKGTLTRKETIAVGGNPNWVEIIELA